MKFKHVKYFVSAGKNYAYCVKITTYARRMRLSNVN